MKHLCRLLSLSSLLYIAVSTVNTTAESLGTQDSMVTGPILLDPFETFRHLEGARKIPKPLEDQWLSSFRNRLNLQTLSQSIATPSEISLQLKEVQRQSLLMSDGDTISAIEVLDEKLEKTPPFANLDDVYRERIALEVAAHLSGATPSQNAETSLPDSVMGACSLPDFTSKLPTKYSSLFSRFCESRSMFEVSDLSMKGALINGQTLPSKGMRKGHYLRHRLRGNFIVTETCQVESANRIDCREKSRKDIFSSFPAAAIRKELLASKPASVLMDGLFVSLPHQENPLVIMPSNRRLAVAEPLRASPSSSSIWKSPWLWAGLAIVAGLAGYGVYEVTRDPVVTTP